MSSNIRLLSVAGLLCLGLAATSRPAHAGFTLTNSTTGLFDASNGTRGVTVTGAEPGFSGTVTDIDVIITFAKADGQTYGTLDPGTPYHNEIVFTLTSPFGTVVTLIAENSFANGTTAFDGVIRFDQAALNVVNVNVNTPQSGTFRPTGAGSLSDFNGQGTTGTWSLFIQDTTSQDALRFRSFDLVVNGGSGPAIATPAPPTLLAGLFGIAGLGIGRRIRRAIAG